MTQKYIFKVLTSFESFKNLQVEWNKILNESRSDSIFLTWEWLYTWAEQYVNSERELFIITIYRNDELVGIAPWYIKTTRFGLFKMRKISFLGSPEGSSDYLDVISRRGLEREISSYLYSVLLGEIPEMWDCLLLGDIPANSLFFLHFVNEFTKDGKYVEVRKGMFCPTLNLPGTREEFFDSLSSNRRQQFRRHLKLLSKIGEVKHDTFTDIDATGVLKEFSTLYEKRWGRDEKQFFQFLDKFIARANGKRWIQIDFMSVNDEKVAGILHLNYNNRAYYYLMAIDKTFQSKISMGNVLLGLCIQNAIKRKLSAYDFLKGDENFKFHWTSDGSVLIDVAFYQRKIGPVIQFSLDSMKRIGKVIFR